MNSMGNIIRYLNSSSRKAAQTPFDYLNMNSFKFQVRFNFPVSIISLLRLKLRPHKLIIHLFSDCAVFVQQFPICKITC